MFIPSFSPHPLRIVAQHEGGFGRVFVVEAPSGERCALKTLKWEQGHQREALRDEALKLAEIPPHPNVLSVLGVEWIGGDPFIAMPCCEGSLAQAIEAGVPPETIPRRIGEVAAGVTFLHDRVRMLHLDLKPQNVLIDQNGTCLLSDFGLARCLPQPSPEGLHKDVFVTGVTGTVAYMSPEHFVSQQLTGKSDVFALGIILYELLTGRHPFLANTFEGTVARILYSDPFMHAPVSNALWDVCRRCLEKNPVRRPSASQVVNLLDEAAIFAGHTTQTFDLPASINRACAYMGVNEFEKAEALLLTCIEHHPWSLLARVNLSELYLITGRPDKALDMGKTALQLVLWRPDERSCVPTLYTNLSFLYLSVDLEEALCYATRATSICPDDWQAHTNAAEACRLMAERGSPDWRTRVEEGLAHISRALAINSADVTSRITYGNLLLLRGDIASLCPLAVTLLNETGGDNIPARVLAIRTMIATGQLDDAEQWLTPMAEYAPLKMLCDQLYADIRRRRMELSAGR